MPRIDPLQLLKCLSVLLSPDGGILSRDEVPRLVNLMTKFSKKLVSKCVYVLILKNTESSLVDMFMAEGGWALIQTWLQDAAQSGNWDLVREILDLLLVTPVDVERLKLNCLPKLIKNLSRREDLGGVAQLSNQIVQNWLAIVKGTGQNSTSQEVQQMQPETLESNEPKALAAELQSEETVKSSALDNEPTQNEASGVTDSATYYQVSLRDGKQIIKKLCALDETDLSALEGKDSPKSEVLEEPKDKKTEEKDRSKSKSSSSSKSSSRSSHSSSSSSSKSRDKDKKSSSSKSSSSSSKSKSSSSSSSSSSRDKDKRDKDRHRSNGSLKSSKSSTDKSNRDKKDSKEKDPSEKQAEKDKDTLARIKPQTVDKLGRIPKKSSSSSVDEKTKDDNLKKKPSFSILDRKTTGDERTKTVKVFNSKMRSTGLEEEVKPPPPRSAKKATPSVQLPTIPTKRPSPPRETSSMPPEKKIKIDKIDVPERPGAIKLIPPKPKPPVLQESDIFMDALAASATTKKEPKKRKRRPSVTKDALSSPSSSPATDTHTATSPTKGDAHSPTLGLKNIAPINFYQDTLTEETEEKDKKDENKENDENNELRNEEKDSPSSPVANDNNNGENPSPPKIRKTSEDGLRGVLLYTKKKGPKRSIKWKSDADLVEVRYFELDETERVNVTKTFMDMAKLEMSGEREALQLSRKLVNEDTMEPQTAWRVPFLCDQPELLAAPGSKSLEKDIQFAREKSVLQALYFDKRRIPDSPEEPIPENHQMSDPVMIPLEDPESQEIDLKNTPWPEPKGSPPHVEPQIPPMFQNMNMPPFNPNFNNMPPPQFQGMPPRFGGPVGHPGPQGPGNFGPPNMMPGGNMMPPNMGPPQDMMQQGPVNPNMFGPGPDNFGGPPGDGPNFPIPPFGPNGPGPMNMFPPNNFNHRGGRGGFRRGGNNNGGWVRMNAPGPGNWKRGGVAHRGNRFCKNVQNHGYCRNRDNCPFIHPS